MIYARLLKYIMKFLIIIIISLFQHLYPCLGSDYKSSTFVFPPFWATLGFHKATQTEADLFLGGIRIGSLEGIAVVKLISQDDPDTGSDDDELTGYVVDSTENILGYNPTFDSAAVYGKDDINPAKFKQPHGVDATPEGDVFVADTGNKRIVTLFNNNGKLNYVNSFYGFDEPYDLSHNNNRDIYITDRLANIIKVYDKNGNRLKNVQHYLIKQPTGIEVVDSRDIWHYYKEDFIVIINNSGTELLKLSMNGKIINSLDVSKLLKKKIKLEYITADYYSQILVTDSYNNTIHKFDRNLNYITSFGQFGTGNYEFVKPKGIDIGRHLGQLFVTEQTGGQYYWVGTDIENLKIISDMSGIQIKFLLTEPASVSIILFKNETLVRYLIKDEKIMKYNNDFTFHPEAWGDNFFSKGEYRLIITAVPTYSSTLIFKKVMEQIISIE